MEPKSTITKKITDMSKYGITGAYRFSADIVIKTEQSINVHGRYFPTRKQAQTWLKEQTL